MSVGPWAITSRITGTFRKVQWLNKKDDIGRLRAYLSVHVNTINLLLAERGIELFGNSNQRAGDHHQKIRVELRQSQAQTVDLVSRVESQGVLLKAVSLLLTSLYQMVSGEIKTRNDLVGQAQNIM
jgi:hypothetical protein